MRDKVVDWAVTCAGGVDSHQWFPAQVFCRRLGRLRCRLLLGRLLHQLWALKPIYLPFISNRFQGPGLNILIGMKGTFVRAREVHRTAAPNIAQNACWFYATPLQDVLISICVPGKFGYIC